MINVYLLMRISRIKTNLCFIYIFFYQNIFDRNLYITREKKQKKYVDIIL